MSIGGFVGRQHELAALTDACDAATIGVRSCVLVVGDAGVGKTRLLDEALARSNARVRRGACIPLTGAAIPFGPWRQALGSADTGPVQDEVIGFDSPRDHDRDRVLEVAFGKLMAAARIEPVVVVLEDLHWADTASIDLLSYVVHRRLEASLVIVATMRPDRSPDPAVAAVLAELVRTDGVDRLDLGPMPPVEMSEMVGPLLAARHPAERERLMSSVVARSQGNPFLAHRLASSADPESVPAGIRDLMLAQLTATGPATVDVCRLLSAFARPTSYDGLAAMLPGLDLDGALRVALDAQLMSRSEDDSFAITHALLAAVAYEDMLPGERRGMHERIALWLDSTPDTSLAELAQHWDRAQHPQRALELRVRAGQEALASVAPQPAWLHLRRAVELIDAGVAVPPPPLPGEAEVRLAAARAARLCGDLAASTELLERPAGSGTPDPGVLLELGEVRYSMGQPDLAEQAWTQALADDSLTDQDSLRARLELALARLNLQAGRALEATTLAEHAREAARASGWTALESTSLVLSGYARLSLDDEANALELLDQGLRVAAAAGAVEEHIRAEIARTAVLDRLGRMPEASDSAQAAYDLSRRAGLLSSHGSIAASNLAEVLWALGRWDKAIEVLDEAERFPSQPSLQGYLRVVRAQIETARGRPESAATALDDAARIAGRAGALDPTLTIELLTMRADLALWSADLAGAHDALSRCLSGADGDDTDLTSLAWLTAVAARYQADERKGASGLPDGEVLGLLARQPARPLPLAAAWTLTARAELSRLEARPSLRHWAEAAATWQELTRPYPAAYCRWREAQAAVAAGKRTRAEAAARACSVVATDLGAVVLMDAVKRFAEHARLDLDAPQDADGTAHPRAEGLTPREDQVVGMLAEGRSNREIARALFISERTASVHVSNILRKLDLPRRSAVPAYLAGRADAAGRLGGPE